MNMTKKERALLLDLIEEKIAYFQYHKKETLDEWKRYETWDESLKALLNVTEKTVKRAERSIKVCDKRTDEYQKLFNKLEKMKNEND
jgi:hypothetical protein